MKPASTPHRHHRRARRALLCFALLARTLIATAEPVQSDASAPLFAPPEILTDRVDMALVINAAGRDWQGASPGIARTPKGRLFACLFSGGRNEPQPQNYAIYMVSDDEGKTWLDPFLIVNHPDAFTRITDPSLWCDPLGRLWIFWNQNTRDGNPEKVIDRDYGIWAVRVDNPDAPLDAIRAAIHAAKPVRISDGIRINKPVISAAGEWLQPVSHIQKERKNIHILASADQGATWILRGGVPVRGGIEPMIVGRNDGALWLLTRIGYRVAYGLDGGVAQAFSNDTGRTWSEPQRNLPHPLIGASSRLFFGRLNSGALLFITNDSLFWRRKLTAFLSEDEGKTWPSSLVLDGRDGIGAELLPNRSPYMSGPSYPDCEQAPDGRIFVVWDFGRYHEKEMRLSIFTEADIKAGKFVSPSARDKLVVSRVGPYLDIKAVRTPFPRALALKQGGDLRKLLDGLPKKMAVTDEKNRARTLSGQWIARAPVPGRPGQYTSVDPNQPGEYSVVFIPDKTARHLDTFHLLRITLVIEPV
jgi:hypothetical protein